MLEYILDRNYTNAKNIAVSLYSLDSQKNHSGMKPYNVSLIKHYFHNLDIFTISSKGI